MLLFSSAARPLHTCHLGRVQLPAVLAFNTLAHAPFQEGPLTALDLENGRATVSHRAWCVPQEEDHRKLQAAGCVAVFQPTSLYAHGAPAWCWLCPYLRSADTATLQLRQPPAEASWAETMGCPHVRPPSDAASSLHISSKGSLHVPPTLLRERGCLMLLVAPTGSRSRLHYGVVAATS